jgi:hypothetical protein
MDGLRRRYSHLHPLILQRTIERAESAGEVFDILEAMPLAYPVVWDSETRRWVEPPDIWLENK